VPVSAVLLDGAERTNVSAGHAEHGLGALDWPEQALLLMLGHHLPPGDSAAPLYLVRTEHQTVVLQLSLKQLLSYGQVVGDVL